MPTLITQDEFEHNIHPNPILTMAIPSLTILPVAQLPKKKWVQKGLWDRKVAATPKTKTIQVQGHNRRTGQVHSHLRKINVKTNGNKKESKTTKSKKKGEPKHAVGDNVKDDCKKSVELAHSLHSQYIKDLFNTFKN
jgi:hypothetical protein